jgi:hypothetical protein
MWSEKYMARRVDLRDLAPPDILVLRDLVRFGVLANDQIERRYGYSVLATARLLRLVEAGLVEAWSSLIQDTDVYSATPAGAGVARCGLRPTRPSLQHLRHDVAVVDLADYILEHEPWADFRTEREVARVLRAGSSPTHRWGLKAYSHKPDGLLLTDGKRLAIELEHTDKGELRYAEICRWFALSVRVDGIRWYVDDPKTLDRVRRVNEQHGYAQDVDVTYAPFPPGVVVRRWVRPGVK